MLPGRPLFTSNARSRTHRRSLSTPIDAFASIDLARALTQTRSGDGSSAPSPADEENDTAQMVDALDDNAPLDVRELAMRDPKRARRILANRQSAARSKERKVAYMSALEQRVAELAREEAELEREREELTREMATLGAENEALAMFMYDGGAFAGGTPRKTPGRA